MYLWEVSRRFGALSLEIKYGASGRTRGPSTDPANSAVIGQVRDAVSGRGSRHLRFPPFDCLLETRLEIGLRCESEQVSGPGRIE